MLRANVTAEKGARKIKKGKTKNCATNAHRIERKIFFSLLTHSRFDFLFVRACCHLKISCYFLSRFSKFCSSVLIFSSWFPAYLVDPSKISKDGTLPLHYLVRYSPTEAELRKYLSVYDYTFSAFFVFVLLGRGFTQFVNPL